MRPRVAALALALVGACQGTPEPTARLEREPRPPGAGAEGPSPAPEGAEAEEAAEPGDGQLFGAALEPERALTPLAAIVAEPSRFAGRVVRTEGQIARVCQRMGCWMELRDGEDGPAVRVPMAGHGFFLPRDSAGRRAVMQGRVALRELSAAERAHLESEGARATASALSIEATGVVIE